MFDTHCHLDVAEFAADRERVLARARAHGVSEMLIPAIDAAHWPGLAALCGQHAELHPAFGLHPMFLSKHRGEHLHELRGYLTQHPNAAVGECGLDFYQQPVDKNQQIEILAEQLKLAREFDRPVILHGRRAFDALLAELKRFGVRRGIVHSFSGSFEQARAFIKQGLLLGIGGPLTYPRAKRLHELVRNIELPHWVLETDAPDQPVCGFQGMRNEPMHLSKVAAMFAELTGLSVKTIASQTQANARELLLHNDKLLNFGKRELTLLSCLPRDTHNT